MKNWLIGKDSDARKDWKQEKGTTEDEVVRWHHQLYGHELEQALGVAAGQGSLACCSPWGLKESDSTEWLNWTEFLYFNATSSTFPTEKEIWTHKKPQRCACVHNRKPCEDTVRRCYHQAKERPQKKSNLPIPWSRTSSPQNPEKINFCHLFHPVCGILLWQP